MVVNPILIVGGPFNGCIINDPAVNTINLMGNIYRRHTFIDYNRTSLEAMFYSEIDPVFDDMIAAIDKKTNRLANVFCNDVIGTEVAGSMGGRIYRTCYGQY